MKIYKKDYLVLKKIINKVTLIKAKKIKIIDIRKKQNSLFNYFIICSGKSRLHVKTIYSKIVLSIKKKFRLTPFNIEGLNNYKWVLIDYNSIIINIFLKRVRKFYKIDNFWCKYPIIKI